MSIKKAPPKVAPNNAGLEAFISGAPDAAPVAPAKPARQAKSPDAKPYEKLRGKQIQTTITMQPDELDAINAAAESAGMSRAQFIRLASLKEAKRQSKLTS